MEIVTFVPESIKENPYLEDVATLIEARNAAQEKGDDPLNVGTVYTWPVDDVNKNKVAFSKAANLAGYTARKRHEENVDNEDGTKSLKILFTLTSKHKDRRNKEREHAAKNENGDNGDINAAPVEPTDTPDAPSNEAEENTGENENENGEANAAETVESTPVVRNRRKR